MTAAQQSATYKTINIESNDKKNVIDIRNGVIAFAYYEDIFSPTVTAKMIITTSGDVINGTGLYNGLPVRGGERVQIAIDTRKGSGLRWDDSSEYLHVGKISDVSATNQKETMTLHLVSKEAIKNETSRVYRKYEGSARISENVKKIMSEVIQTNVPFDVDDTQNKYGFIGNSRKPFTVLQSLAAKSVSGKTEKDASAGYVFYQTKSGFKFKSIDGLISEDSVASFVYTDANTSSTSEDTSNRILKYKTTTNTNLLAKLRTGQFASYRVYWNPLTFQFTSPDIGIFTREDYLTGVRNLGQEMVLPEVEDAYGQKISLGEIPSRIITGVQDIGTLGEKNDKSANADPGKYHSQSLMRYNSLFTQQVKMVIPCNTNLEAGNVIKCSFPSVTTNSKKQNEPDPVQSGLYMIKDLCHYFQGQQSYTYLTLVRDTIGLYTPNNTEN
jgi:hypothetical protein